MAFSWRTRAAHVSFHGRSSCSGVYHWVRSFGALSLASGGAGTPRPVIRLLFCPSTVTRESSPASACLRARSGNYTCLRQPA
ncbi:hypothetical protein EXIGLDRAFT_719336 [Exidia glandulosa HHB12029]|uniref:Uncharacterized protein n=1 Tax=Exidia glandulosa HHB12029 TaxID=1314781 RepID=A0A165H4M1_EXIGL|nr:hypothetical protein EXIGLDRAFT_719336 [Exidia glandulosa HHB12029]